MPDKKDDFGKVLQFPTKKPAQTTPAPTGKVQKVPLSAVFKERPPYQIKPSDYEKRSYTHGEFRSVGLPAISLSAHIHPEHWWKVGNLKAGQSHEYTDDQKNNWRVERSQDSRKVRFFRKDSYGDESLKGEGDWDQMVQSLS